MTKFQDADYFDKMLTFAEDAAEMALRARAEGLVVSHKGEGLGQALTQTDLRISRLLHDRFGVRIVEEETAETIGWDRAARMIGEDKWTFVADPIDGTKPYAGGLSAWGTMIAACRNGRARTGVMILPAWSGDRQLPKSPIDPAGQRGILIAAHEGSALWAPTLGGRRIDDLQTLEPSMTPTFHVGWLCQASKRYLFDYERGYFPWCESSAIADAALLATGRLDATVHNHKLWDLAAALPIFEALGFELYRWPDVTPAPSSLIALFDNDFSAHSELWLVCRGRDDAVKLASAIQIALPIPPYPAQIET
ncbi:inositol monophosphatase [Methylobacterium sp. C25]|uniref:inositol monophosphatase family protein n=1 Tax=Methylobacterium sp. C25 TaxID=2721622 RepID=UPI001F1B5D58|nr:inositol monophosphatase family protein [Methylobacterium sp. C25]MCE4222677.1 inositol monophosphatase [Methylobacterium sp. C25]